ncbi:MAG TPA: nucleoside triphosphate hydrolase [Sphingomonas sp.]
MYQQERAPGGPASNDATLGPLIAIVGSDGAGKSTIGEALLAWLRESRRVEMCHLGKQTGNIGRWLRRLPFLGGGVDRQLLKTGDKAREDSGPGAVSALVIYHLSMRRVRRFRRMMKIRRSGVTILADRYPQMAVPSPRMDGTHFNAPHPRSRLVRMLARREQAAYRWMTGYPPDLVIRLNVDLATAAARKPDHRYASLAAKIEQVPRLTYNGAPILDIDATQPLAIVVQQAKAGIARALALRTERNAAAAVESSSAPA